MSIGQKTPQSACSGVFALIKVSETFQAGAVIRLRPAIYKYSNLLYLPLRR